MMSLRCEKYLSCGLESHELKDHLAKACSSLSGQGTGNLCISLNSCDSHIGENMIQMENGLIQNTITSAKFPCYLVHRAFIRNKKTENI